MNGKPLCVFFGCPVICHAGNPYDWIFMWALNDENPLWAFRFFIGEVFAAKEETADADD